MGLWDMYGYGIMRNKFERKKKMKKKEGSATSEGGRIRRGLCFVL
jgi:hypothetical protein